MVAGEHSVSSSCDGSPSAWAETVRSTRSPRITSLGLVQMTRKRIGQGLLEAFSETCEHCKGRGVIIHLDPVPEAQAGRTRAATASRRRAKRRRTASQRPRCESNGRRRSRRGRGGSADEPAAEATGTPPRGRPPRRSRCGRVGSTRTPWRRPFHPRPPRTGMRPPYRRRHRPAGSIFAAAPPRGSDAVVGAGPFVGTGPPPRPTTGTDLEPVSDFAQTRVTPRSTGSRAESAETLAAAADHGGGCDPDR